MSTTRTGTGITGVDVEPKMETYKEKAKEIVEQGAEKVEQLKSRVVEAKDQAVAKGNAFLDRVTDLIKANPLKSVAIAFGVGYIGMRLFRRR